MGAEELEYYCNKCNKTMAASQFYLSNNLEKHPDGRMPQCKKCLTLHVDNWDPETYLWILEDIDVPYVPKEWNALLAKYGTDRSKLTGTTILGRYLSKMKLKQYKDYRWEHTQFLQEMEDLRISQAMKRQGYDQAEIATAIEKSKATLVDEMYYAPQPPSQEEDIYDDIELDLTEEDKMALRIKWGKQYRPDEWVQLEKLYEEMMDSYDIQSAGHIDTLKLVCKTSLKANQLLDIGDVDGAQKMIKMYDGLMRSGKFTAQQNKAENGEYIDSISELVAICETDGFMPRFYTDGPQDKVDRTIQDLQSFTRTLVTEEMNLGNLIEGAVKQIELDKLKEAERNVEAADDEEALEAELFNDDSDDHINSYEDFTQFRELEAELSDVDTDTMKKLLEGEL